MMLPRRRHLLVWAGLVAVPACGAARYAWIPGVMRGVTWTCADPSSDLAQQLRTWTIGYVAPQSPKADRARVVMHLPRITADSVRAVTDPDVCRRAGLTYARENQQHLAPGTYQTLVISAGDHYLVRSVTAPEPAGEWNLMLVLDARFRASIALLGF